MAKVLLPFEGRRGAAPVPPICIRCGRPATRMLKMMFFGRTSKFLGFRFTTSGTEDEYVVLPVPLCEGHPFMGQFRWIMYGGILLMIPVAIVGELCKPYFHFYLIVFPFSAMLVAGALFATYVSFTSIGGAGFDDEGATVTGASPKFCRALKEEDWTAEEVAAAMKKNRKVRGKQYLPFWVSPYFYVPVATLISIIIFTPIGYVFARQLPTGPWPAGGVAAKPADGAPPADPVAANGQPAPAAVNGQPAPPPQPAGPEAFNPRSLPGLVGYWALDDGQGGAAQDGSGHNILALLHGGEWVAGVRGKALRLNGSGDYLDLGPADGRLSFAANAPFTIACWVNTTADAGTISSFRRRGQPHPVVDLAFKDGKFRGWVRDDNSGTGGATPVGGKINDGRWHHVALVRQPGGMIELYIDGLFQAKEQGKNSGGPITTDLHTVGFERFVAESGTKGPVNFAGMIDEFCVFDRALGADDLAVLNGTKK